MERKDNILLNQQQCCFIVKDETIFNPLTKTSLMQCSVGSLHENGGCKTASGEQHMVGNTIVEVQIGHQLL